MGVLPPERGRELLLLILGQLPGVGAARTGAIIARFGDDPGLLEAGPEAWSSVPGFGHSLATKISATLRDTSWFNRALDAARDQLDRADRLGVHILTLLDPDFPALLHEIYDPPPLLFVRGDPSCLTRPSVAIVGTRRATSYGQQATALFSRDLALSGHAVVSGLAYGIDSEAHRATLEAGGWTTAVLGCGVDIIYTDRRGRIWPKIVERGAIVSEEWIGQEPAPENFPKRNRIISGLSAGTLVVESDVKGGSMITASCALEQNREVFAVPGSIFSPNSRGTNLLIQRGQAKPVLSAEDILAELPRLPAPSIPDRKSPPAGPDAPDRESAPIIESLASGPLHIDLIGQACGLPLDLLMMRLFELEMQGLIAQEPGQIYRKRH
jgi:DNA processing protein